MTTLGAAHDPRDESGVIARLTEVGLSATEARAYLALLRSGPLTVRELSDILGLSRPSLYPALYALADVGFVASGVGIGARFTASPPDQAIPALMQQRRREVDERERIAADLTGELQALVEDHVDAAVETVEVLRHPRVIAERFVALESSAESQIDVFVKAPFFAVVGNEPEAGALGRGVRCRGLYERAVLDDPAIAPYLDHWQRAGEEMRVHDGDLPLKAAIFDQAAVVMPLERPGDRGPVTVVLRHPAVARFFRVTFDALWAQGTPYAP